MRDPHRRYGVGLEAEYIDAQVSVAKLTSNGTSHYAETRQHISLITRELWLFVSSY